jgi:cob(I)alamin adenosyltransferase
MKVYTKTGDKGITSLYDGNKVCKNSIIFQTIGEIDELSSRIGFLCSTISDEDLYLSKKLLLRKIQGMLQEINSNIATINPNRKCKLQEFEESNVAELESVIDEMELVNPKLTNLFYLV